MATTQQLETQLLEHINKKEEPVSFEQKEKDIDFSMSAKATFLESRGKVSLPVVALCVATSASISGIISGVTGNLLGGTVAGLNTMIAGGALKYTIAKTGKLADYADGVLISGFSQLISSLMGGSLQNIFGSAFGQQTKEQFKQEVKPCDDIHKIRSDVAW